MEHEGKGEIEPFNNERVTVDGVRVIVGFQFKFQRKERLTESLSLPNVKGTVLCIAVHCLDFQNLELTKSH